MTLSEGGESRVRGYLFVLERSLRTFLPPEVTSDALREVESHIRERVSQAEAAPDERAALERVLAELGPPLRVAQAYSVEMTLDEAVTTGRTVPIARALWHMATTSVAGFLWAMIMFTGWMIGVSFLWLAVLKPVFPGNVGFQYVNGRLNGFGAVWPLGTLAPGVEVHGGYWLIPACMIIGLGVLVFTQRASRRLLSWMRSRRPSARLRVRVEVHDGTTNGKW
jgi:hypothetical protein